MRRGSGRLEALGRSVGWGEEGFVVEGLGADDGGDAEDIVGAGAPGHVGGGAVEAEEDLAVGIGAGDVLDELAADVGGVEVGENKDIGAAGDFAFGEFAAGDFGDDRGVELEFAVEVGLEVVAGGDLLGEGGGGLDFADGGVGSAALGGEGEHGDARRGAEEVAGEAGGFDGDVGELLDGGVGDDAAVGQDEDAVFADPSVFDLQDHATGGGGGLGGDFDDLEEGPEDAARDFVGARDQAIGLVQGDHHGAVIIGFEHDLAGLMTLQALASAQDLVTADEGVEVFGLFGVDDADAFEGDVEGGGGRFDAGAVAEEDRDAETEGIELAGGLEDAWLSAFGEDNSFGVPLQALDDRADETHGR